MMDSPLTVSERKRLQEAGTLIQKVVTKLEKTIKKYEKEHDIAEVFQYRKILEIARSQEIDDEQKIGQIAEIMRSFHFLCQLDDIRDEISDLSEQFTTFLESGIFQPSNMPKIRSEFYETVAALLIADEELK